MLNDSFLNTGMTSASSEPKTPREAQAEAKEQDRQKLKPAAQVVLDAIELERSKVTDIRSFIDASADTETIKHELMARQLYLSYLNSLEAKIKNILAEKPVKKRGADNV